MHASSVNIRSCGHSRLSLNPVSFLFLFLQPRQLSSPQVETRHQPAQQDRRDHQFETDHDVAKEIVVDILVDFAVAENEHQDEQHPAPEEEVEG